MTNNTDKDFTKLIDENIALERKLTEQIEYNLQVLNEKSELVDKIITHSKRTVIAMEQLKIAMDSLREIAEKFGIKNPEILKSVDTAISKILLKGGE